LNSINLLTLIIIIGLKVTLNCSFVFCIFTNLNINAMTLITLKINERTKAGKMLKDLIELFSKENKGVEIVSDDSSYEIDFEEKIKNAEEDIKNGKAIRINPKNVWEGIM